MEEEYVSLRPSDAVHGGGRIPEGPYEIVGAAFIMFDYGGKQPVPVPALKIDYKNPEGLLFDQAYSAGDARNLAPTEDGKRLKRIGSVTGLNDSSNCFLFMSSLVNAGFSEDKLGNDISVIVGTHVEVVYHAIQEREIKGQKRAASVIAVVGKIHVFPWDAKAAATKPAAKSARAKSAGASVGASAPTPPPNGNEAALHVKALDALSQVLKAAPNKQLDKKSIPALVYKKIPATDQDRGDVLNLVVQDTFLSGLIDAGVMYDSEAGVVIYMAD